MFTNEPALSHEDIKRYLKEGRRLRSAWWTTLMQRTAGRLWHATRRCIACTTNVVDQLTQKIVRARRHNSTIHILEALNDQTLKDIGLHRSEIYSAVNELFDGASSSRLRHPSWTARTGIIRSQASTANDESFVGNVFGSG